MTLEEQIRAANWGGEWNAGGVDRVAELAGLLRSQGITSLGPLVWSNEIGRAFEGSDPTELVKGADGQWYRNTAAFDFGGVDAGPSGGAQIFDERTLVTNPALERRLRIGDQTVGFLGNANNDGSYSSANQYTQVGDRIGWSARGDGNVSYNVVQGPNGLEIRPTWGSSSDADRIRSAAMLVGGIVGGGMALDTAMYGSVGGGMAASGGAGGTAGAAAGGAAGATGAGGGGTLGTWSGWSFDPTALGLGGAGGSGGGSMLGSFDWGDAIQIGGNLLSGYLGDRASQRSSDALLDAGRESNALNRYIFDTIRSDNEPFRQTSLNALGQIQSLLRDPSSISQDPGYQFGMNQGINALSRSAAGRGMTYSGQNMKDITQFGQDYAGTKLNESYNRLANLAGMGQVANQSNASAGMNYGNQVGNTLQNMGNARGSAYMGSANSWGQALGNIGNYFQYRNLLGGS